MLKSQPVRCQTVRHTQNSLVHSRIHSFSSFFPSFSHSCCLSISFRPVLEKCGPPLPSQRFQTEYKVCNSNKLVVKGEKKKPVANYSCTDSLFRNLISAFVSPQKTCVNEVRAPLQPGRESSRRLLSYSVNRVTLPKRTISLWFERLGTEAMG